jgi:hypothetical protein
MVVEVAVRAVKAVAMTSAVAAAKTVGEGAAALLAPTALTTAGADKNQPKSGRNGGRGGGNGGSHGRGKDSSRGAVTSAPTALATTGAGEGGGKQRSTKKVAEWRLWRQQRHCSPLFFAQPVVDQHYSHWGIDPKVSHPVRGYGHPGFWLRCALQPFGIKTLSQAYALVRINPSEVG